MVFPFIIYASMLKTKIKQVLTSKLRLKKELGTVNEFETKLRLEREKGELLELLNLANCFKTVISSIIKNLNIQPLKSSLSN